MDFPTSESSSDLLDVLAPNSSKLATGIVTRIVRIARQIENKQSQVVAKHYLTGPQFQMLMLLSRSQRGGLTQIELSQKLMVSKPNITGMVKRLEKSDLIKRKQGNDARAKIVSLTEKGRGAVAEATNPLDQLNGSLLNFMGEADQLQLMEVLGKLAEQIRSTSADRRPQPDRPNPSFDGTTRLNGAKPSGAEPQALPLH